MAVSISVATIDDAEELTASLEHLVPQLSGCPAGIPQLPGAREEPGRVDEKVELRVGNEVARLLGECERGEKQRCRELTYAVDPSRSDRFSGRPRW